MRSGRTACWTTFAFFALCALAGTADGAQRHFVSTHGNDSSGCMIAQPCRSFGAALAVVDVGGEIIALDSGGYGPVTINKSVSLIAPPGVYAGISVVSPGSAGVLIDAGSAGVVTLRGLSLVSLSTSTFGVRVTSAAEVRVEGCTLDNFTSAINTGALVQLVVSETTIRSSGAGTGIVMANEYDGHLVVNRSLVAGRRYTDFDGITVSQIRTVEIVDTVVAGCHRGIRGIATDYQPDNSSIVLERVSLVGNNVGIEIVAAAPRMTIANVKHSTISGNAYGAIVDYGGYLLLTGTQITANYYQGIWKQGSGVVASVGDNVCSGNGQVCPAATPAESY